MIWSRNMENMMCAWQLNNLVWNYINFLTDVVQMPGVIQVYAFKINFIDFRYFRLRCSHFRYSRMWCHKDMFARCLTPMITNLYVYFQIERIENCYNEWKIAGWFVSITREKGSDRTQSHEKDPIPIEMSKKAKWQQKTPPKSSITQRLRTNLGQSVSQSSYSHPTGVVNRFSGQTFPLPTTAM